MIGAEDLIHLACLGMPNMTSLSIGSTFHHKIWIQLKVLTSRIHLNSDGEMTSIHSMNLDGKLAITGLSKRTTSLSGKIKCIQKMDS